MDTLLSEQKIRSLVSSVYDIQKLRISVGNRIVASFNAQLADIEPSEEGDTEKAKFLYLLLKEWKDVTTAYVEAKSSIKAWLTKNGSKLTYIKSVGDYKLIQHYNELVDTEKGMTKLVSQEVVQHPMWEAFFKDVIGCGPMIAAIIISYFNVETARHPSSFWKYAGLDVVDGKGRTRGMLVDKVYTKADGTTVEAQGLSYNPFVKTKLLGVLATGFLKKPGCKYDLIYRGYKNRLENREPAEDGEELTKGHIHRMALRYSTKMFLRDLWIVWREMAGYDIGIPEYEVQFLGKPKHGYNAADEGEDLMKYQDALTISVPDTERLKPKK